MVHTQYTQLKGNNGTRVDELVTKTDVVAVVRVVVAVGPDVDAVVASVAVIMSNTQTCNTDECVHNHIHPYPQKQKHSTTHIHIRIRIHTHPHKHKYDCSVLKCFRLPFCFVLL